MEKALNAPTSPTQHDRIGFGLGPNKIVISSLLTLTPIQFGLVNKVGKFAWTESALSVLLLELG